MKTRSFCALFLWHFCLLSLNASSIEDPLLGCPDRILSLVRQMKSHGQLHAPLDWERFSKERPQALAPWLVTFEWFEMASPEVLESLRIGLSKGHSLEEIIEAAQSQSSAPIPESVVHIFRLLRRDFKRSWPEEHPSMLKFLSALKPDEIISLLHFAYEDEFLGAKNIRDHIEIAVRHRATKKEKDFFKFVATSPQSSLAFTEFFTTIDSTFCQEVKEKILLTQNLEEEWQDFSKRHRLNSTKHPKSTELIHRIFKEFSA